MTVPLCIPVWLTCAIAIGRLVDAWIVWGLPATDPTDPSVVTTAPEPLFASWVHQLSDVLILSGIASYGTSRTSNSGNQQSVAASVAMEYLLSQTLAATARYAYFNSVSSTPNQSFYQDLVLVGLNKTF